MKDDAQTRLADAERRLTELRTEAEALLKEVEQLQHTDETARAESEAAPRANGQPVIQGGFNNATSLTYLSATQGDPSALYLVGNLRGLVSLGQQSDGVFGFSPGQSGVVGTSSNGTGVRAVSQTGTALAAGSTAGTGAAVSGNGVGLVADNNGQYGGYGVIALGQVKGIGLYASGERAAVRLGQAPYAGPPTADYHDVGELVLDAKADLYLCRKAGTPGSWAKLN
ncbi:hypothetical protein AB0J38_38155 [Streptomyces sp. NPDC050095]|uniref:hypothetical protein n=1 Tax=unclassified Streptomyces TaxID=2593676 RepID=UPI0034478121